MKTPLARLWATLNKSSNEVAEAHQRITLLTQRVAQIEHYAGMRKHRFADNDKRWHFNQLSSDVKHGRVPRERASVLRVA